MKSSAEVVNKRRDEIIQHLEADSSIKNDTLAKLLNTSTLTIRRDLQYLEDKGIVLRHYGGATVIKKSEDIKKEVFVNRKMERRHKIAKFAASLIEDGDIIFINSSSTALSILNYVKTQHVIVITNNGKILGMQLPPNIEVVLTGGEVYGRKQSMIGEYALNVLAHVSASKSFLGVSGIDGEKGLSTFVMQETVINKEMIRRTIGSTYIVADSTKIGVNNNFSSGGIEQVSCLITDNGVKEEDIKGFQYAGINVKIVE